MKRSSSRGRAWSALFAEGLISHNLVLTAGTVLAGLLGLAFQSLISHRLSPADYAAAATLVTLIGLIGAFSAGLGAVAARSAGQGMAAGDTAGAAAELRAGNRSLLIAGSLLGATGVVLSVPAGAILHVGPALVVIGAVSVPLGLATPFLAGALQGAQRFGGLALFYTVQAAVKLALAATLGWWGGAIGVVAGVSLGVAVTYGFLCVQVRAQLRDPASRVDWRALARYGLVVLPGGAAAGVLLATDVVMVKSLFPAAVAGRYAVVAVIGRAVYWGAGSVAGVLFPKVVFRDARGTNALPLMAGSLLLILAGGGALVLLLALMGGPVVRAFAGPAYASAAPLMAPYALGMSFLGAALVLGSAHQARGRAGFLLILAAAVVGEPLGIALAHRDLAQVVVVVDLAMGALMLGLAALYVADERRLGAGRA